MNRKKINKLLSSTISVIYLANSSPVFALDSQSKEDTLLSNEASTTETDIVNPTESEQESTIDDIEDIQGNEPSLDIEGPTEETEVFENIEETEDIEIEESQNSFKDEEENIITNQESEKTIEDLEINQNVDTNSNISIQNIEATTTICSPTVSYSNGYVTIEDNGVISTLLNMTETFDNPNSPAFEFSNKDWTISNGVMTSKKIADSQNTKNTIVLNLDMDCELTIKAKVSSEYYSDWGRIDVNGTKIFEQSGTENFNYTTITHKLKKGINTINFTYTKNYGRYDGLDALLIDEIKVAAEEFQSNSERLEYRINGGQWETYSAPFECEEGALIECRSFYDSTYSDINSTTIDFVKIPDENLYQILKNALNKDESNPNILIDELKTLSGTLDLRNKNISDLSGLEYATNLNGLLLSGNPISDISVIEHIPNIETLIAKNTNITDITSILNTPSLKTIDLEGDITYTETDLENLANMSNIISLTAKFNAPNTILNIGNTDFSNAQYLNFKGSIFKEFNAINTDSLQHINLNLVNLDSVTVDNVNSLLTASIDEGTTNTINITNCNDFELLSLQKVQTDSLFVKNLQNDNTLSITLDYGTFNDVTIDSVSATTANFNSSSVNIKNLTIQNSLFENGNFYDSIIENFNLIGNNKIRYFNANNLNVKNTIDFTGVDFQNFNGGSIICPNIIITNCPSANYIALDYASSNNVIIENCINAQSVSFGGSEIENISIKNMDSLLSIYIYDMNCGNFIVENCITMSGLSNNPKANIKNLRFINIPNLSGRDLSESNIETIIIEGCDSFDNLNISSNNIKDISGISSLTALPALDISNNHITDISPLNNITNLTPENINALNQTIVLEDIISKAGTVSIKPPTVIDYNGDVLSGVVKSDLPSRTKAVDDLILGEFEEGIFTINIEFTSDIVDYSLTASQKITVDGTAPSIDLTQDNNNWTKDSVFITVTATDNISGVDYIKLPNGAIIHDSIFEFEATKNGDYEFEAVDLVGNVSKQTISISNIDTEAPTLKVTPNTTDYTKNNVLLTVEAEDILAGLDYIKLPNGDIINESTFEFEVTKNGDYEFEAVDLVGNISKQVITVYNIDTEAPILSTTLTYNDDYTEAILKIEATDLLSGVLNITLPDGQVIDANTTSFKTTKNGDYTIVVTDLVGNSYSKVITVDKIKDTPVSDNNTNNDNNDTVVDKPTDDSTIDTNSSNENDNNSNSENNLDKLPNSSGFGVFAPIIAMMSLAIGAISFKKKK